MKQIIPLCVVGFIVWMLCWNNSNQETHHEATTAKVSHYEAENFDSTDLIDDVVECISYVEGYSAKPYYCGAWSVGFGTTRYADGSPVSAYSRSLNRAEAREALVAHLVKYAFPAIKRNITRELSYSNYIGCCMFICSVGEGRFEESSLPYAINHGYSDKQCAEIIAQYVRIHGEVSNGLKKRRWLEGAIYCGYITANDIRKLKPAAVYSCSLAKLYHRGVPDYRQSTISEFLETARARQSYS